MRRYFLTGCTGWIGKALVKELLSRHDTGQIVLLTRNAQRSYAFYALDRRVQLYEGDITITHFPDSLFTDVIHGANEPSGHNDYYAIVEGTRRILEWSQAHGIDSVLLLSSGAAARADTPYGKAKRMAEMLLRIHTTEGKIARIFTIVGDETPSQYAIGEFVRQAVSDGKITVTGGRNVARSYLHIEDCARWLLSVLDDGKPRQPYDVGGDAPVTILALALLVGEVFGVPVHAVERRQEPDLYLPDLTAARAIGCRQTIDLPTALERIRDKAGLRNPELEPSRSAS